MALPPALQAQLDVANATLEAINKPPEPAQDAPKAQEPTEPQPLEPTPEEPPAPAPAPAAPTTQSDEVWESRYKTLKGLFDAEVPRLQNEVKGLRQQLEGAVARLDQAADKANTPEPQAKSDPRDVENFGQDLVDMVNRVAQASLGSVATAFEQRLARIEESLKGTNQQVAVTAEQAFFDRLTKLVPEWEVMNSNQAFLDWLAQVDPILGQPRQAALNAAQQSLNSDRAAAVFNAFAATLPKAPTKPATSTVDKQVSPKGSAASPAPQQNQPKVWAQQEVVDFYTAKRMGEFRGREADAQAIEAQINLAMAEGRIR